MAVSWGEGICCGVIVCNVVILIFGSVFFSEGGEGIDVMDDKVWVQGERTVTTVGDDTMAVPRLVEVKLQKNN